MQANATEQMTATAGTPTAGAVTANTASYQVELRDVSFAYPGGPTILDRVKLGIAAGERVGLVGPSGGGKSTLAKILAGYEKPASGEVLFEGKPLPTSGYCPVQLIYQHPENAVNPKWRMERILNEAWTPDAELLDRMGIERAWLSRWPSELSGGELQRFCIARALGPQTRFLIADEISTMLDVITQAQIWNTVLEVAQERNMGMLVVTHDAALAERVCTRVVHLDEISAA